MMTEKPEEDAKGDEGAPPAAMAGLRAGEWALAGMLALAVVLAVWAAFGEKSRVIGPEMGVAVGICWLVAAALAVKQRKRRSGRVALAVLGVLGALGLAVAALGMFGQGPAPTEAPVRAAGPAGQETPEKTVAKMLTALADLDARRCLECMGGPEDRVRRVRENLDCLVASERLHQSAVKVFGEAGWKTLSGGLEQPIITQEMVRRHFGRHELEAARIEGDRAKVEVHLLNGSGDAELVRAGGCWRVVGGAMTDGPRMDAGTLASLLALRIKVIAPGATVEAMRKEFVGAFGAAREICLPSRPAPATQAVSLVISIVVPTPEAPQPYMVDGRRMDLAGVRSALAAFRGANPQGEVLIRADRDSPHKLFADLVGACRECGYDRANIGYLMAEPASQPAAGG